MFIRMNNESMNLILVSTNFSSADAAARRRPLIFFRIGFENVRILRDIRLGQLDRR
jgi:hypothetical protein